MHGIGRTTAMIIIVLGMALAATAAELPFGPLGYATLTYDSPTGLAVGDIDEDGKTDMVICSPQEGSVRVHYYVEGSGYIHFDTIASSLDSPYVLAIGDLDNDGDIDVVVGQNLVSSEPELFWIENPLNGGGSWTEHSVRNFTTTTVMDVDLTDVDRDGFLDIAYATGTVGSDTEAIWVSWNDGTPDAGWTSSMVADLADAPSSIALADIDGDGDDDIVASNPGGDWIRWYDNPRTPGGGWFSETIDATVSGPADVAVGDFDRDGRPDVAVADETTDTVTWYENNGSWTAHSVAASWNGAVSLSTADLDADGDDDLVAASSAENEVRWLENDGTSGWPSHLIYSSFSGANNTAVGDFDDDGDLDVAATASTGSTVGWWRNEVIHRRFAEDGSVTIDDGLGNPQGVAVGDLNNDGLNDVVFAEREGDRIVAEISVSTGGHAWLTYVVASGFDGARDVAIADINNDGAPDIVATAVADDEVAWWENDGTANPSWTKHGVTAGLNGAHSVVAADFDRDGDLDIAAAGRSADQLRWYSNTNGTGTSWGIPASSVIASIDGPYELASGDLNNDGHPDLVLTAYEGDAVKSFHYNPAMLRFDEYTLAIMVDGPRGIDLADLDDDGDLDAVSTISIDDQVRWWANDGTGEVWLGNTLDSSFDGGAGVTAADLDGDGDVDVVATSQSDDDVTGWINDGDGSSWTKRIWESNLDTPWSVATAFIDDDGDLDLVVTAAGNADSVTWYSNVGGQFHADAYPQSPAAIHEDERTAVLYFTLSHHGRDGIDSSLELAGLTLRFTDSTGAPLNSSNQVNDLIAELEIYHDEGGFGFDPAEDSLFFTDSWLSTTAGVLTLDLTASGSDSWVDPGDWEGFWVAIHATSDFVGADPTTMIIEVDEELILANRIPYGLPLTGEPGSVKATGVINFEQVLFADNFESGDTDAWGDVSP